MKGSFLSLINLVFVQVLIKQITPPQKIAFFILSKYVFREFCTWLHSKNQSFIGGQTVNHNYHTVSHLILQTRKL